MISSRSPIARGVAAAALAVLLSTGVAACTSDPSRKPPTLGGGVNLNVGADGAVKVRNLLIVTRDGEQGLLDGAVTGTQPDELTSVSGQLIDADNNPAPAPLPFTGGPIEVAPTALTQLGGPDAFTVSGDLPPGLTMRVTLNFATAGPITADVPIIDGNNADYRTVAPDPSASGTPEATTSETPEATPEATPTS
ncbi:hypothetical protein GGQ54_002144 [Naumannella cuiyingiana]|uniref:Copper chaperone PCu(A)C n=1 Tax=Naumannella cuiyingiana TaxID=1347891 RepID=A0A7Z0ILF1_9ACTN|nr:hypothetical protein [Naumannella cuiyingiana]NYI71584.1 hypothetical protein [Naumannella cuiyingiana]